MFNCLFVFVLFKNKFFHKFWFRGARPFKFQKTAGIIFCCVELFMVVGWLDSNLGHEAVRKAAQMVDW